uniref:Uncharacterized protein n=1 Tax=Aegilops tauschii subsp. strangulata TaxID=200361 RepID=A0A453SY80_AEGTS
MVVAGRRLTYRLCLFIYFYIYEQNSQVDRF